MLFEHATSTRYDERRSLSSSVAGYFKYAVDFEVQRESETTPVLAPGQSLLLIAAATENEHLYGEEHQPSSKAGLHLVELWQEGSRVDVAWAELPALGAVTTVVDLEEWLGHDLETHAGAPLHRNLTSTTRSEGTATATFEYDLTQTATPAGTDESVLAAVEELQSAAPPGRYEIDSAFGPLTLDIYPQGAIYAAVAGTTRPLIHELPGGGFGEGAKARHGSGFHRVTYFPHRAAIEVLTGPSQNIHRYFARGWQRRA